jgi:hypothetical protein
MNYLSGDILNMKYLIVCISVSLIFRDFNIIRNPSSSAAAKRKDTEILVSPFLRSLGDDE